MDSDALAIQAVEKYKMRLDSQNEAKKLLRALNKLGEIEMTIGILQQTGIGKAVNSLRKHKEVGGFAKALVSSWKELLSKKDSSNLESPSKLQYESPTQQNHTLSNDEYDPSGNWEMEKKMAKKKKLKYSEESEEYDPTQNWQMATAAEYMPECPQIKHRPTKKDKIKQTNKHEVPKSLYEQDDASDDERNFLPNDSDSREDESSEEKGVASYTPSVTSTTLYSNKKPKSTNYASSNRLSDSEQTTKRKQDLMSGHKNNTKGKSAAQHEEKANSTSVKASKRKSDVAAEAPLKKVKSNTPVKKTNKKTKKATGDLSFEDFMSMDTTKKTKKKKKVSQKSANTSQAMQDDSSPFKPKVELHLPKIQATYRPLPLSDPSDSYQPSTSNHKPSSMTDAMAAELHSQRSSRRMQIYSGQKTSFLPKMMSLYDQCMNVLLNNIEKLDVIGVPYDIIKPVLVRCTAEQLYRLEDVNPYLLDDSDELWEKLSMQDFKGFQPDEMESWRELYLRLHDAREAKLARLTQSIQAKVSKAKPLEKRTKLAYVGIGQAKAPRNVLRAQLKYGTAGKRQISSADCNGSSSLKQQTTELRMSVPVGSITAASVDSQSASRSSFKKQPPKIAPMMAKTLKTINKLRMRR